MASPKRGNGGGRSDHTVGSISEFADESEAEGRRERGIGEDSEDGV